VSGSIPNLQALIAWKVLVYIPSTYNKHKIEQQPRSRTGVFAAAHITFPYDSR
jgi:hypothetical protein